MPVLLAYVLPFINVGLYWNNHPHLMQATARIDGRVLRANLFLLFWRAPDRRIERALEDQRGLAAAGCSVQASVPAKISPPARMSGATSPPCVTR